MSISNTRREAGISSCGQKSVDWSPSLDQCLRPHQYSEFHYQMLSTEAINRVSHFCGIHVADTLLFNTKTSCTWLFQSLSSRSLRGTVVSNHSESRISLQSLPRYRFSDGDLRWK